MVIYKLTVIMLLLVTLKNKKKIVSYRYDDLNTEKESYHLSQLRVVYYANGRFVYMFWSTGTICGIHLKIIKGVINGRLVIRTYMFLCDPFPYSPLHKSQWHIFQPD